MLAAVRQHGPRDVGLDAQVEGYPVLIPDGAQAQLVPERLAILGVVQQAHL